MSSSVAEIVFTSPQSDCFDLQVSWGIFLISYDEESVILDFDTHLQVLQLF